MQATILSVEDDPQILYILQHLLEKNGYKVHTASNGLEAIELLSNLEIVPDLIISDISMPEMNGYDFYNTVSKNPNWNAIPFIFLTGRADLDDIRFAKKLGVDDYIVKPFHIQDLMASIEGKLAKSFRNRQIRSEIESRLRMSPPMESLNAFNASAKQSINSNFDCTWFIEWDKNFKSLIFTSYPGIETLPFSVNDLESQITSIVQSINFSDTNIEIPEVLINLAKFDRMCYIIFYKNQDIYYSMGIIAPNIHYLAYLRIQEIIISFMQSFEPEISIDLSEIGERVKLLLSYNDEKIQEVWIFYESGIELVNYAPETELSPELFSGFITAMQAFVKEICKEEFKMFRFGESQYLIYRDFCGHFLSLVNVINFHPKKL